MWAKVAAFSMKEEEKKPEDKQIIKDCKKDSHLRNNIQRAFKIIFQKEISEQYGTYYMFNGMPLYLMALMIRSFKSNSFDTIFERQSNSISGAGFKRPKNCKGNTKYWMFDY